MVLDRKDPDGSSDGQFRFLINGIEIMCKGTNWVPLDAFHCRDAERYDAALSLVKDIGCNIIRCWGGNVYEDHLSLKIIFGDLAIISRAISTKITRRTS